MTFDPDWPHGHVTRDGRKVRIVCKDRKGNRPICALITKDDDDESWQSYCSDGTCGMSDLALMNAPAPKRKLECWVNVYKNGSFGHFWLTKEVADVESLQGTSARIACKHVIVEEGEGLDD